jgi:hypothetical protein
MDLNMVHYWIVMTSYNNVLGVFTDEASANTFFFRKVYESQATGETILCQPILTQKGEVVEQFLTWED